MLGILRNVFQGCSFQPIEGSTGKDHRAGQGEADLQQAQGRQQEAAGGPDLSAGDVRQDQHGACQDQGHRDQAQGGLRESHLRPGDVQRTVTHNFCIFLKIFFKNIFFLST